MILSERETELEKGRFCVDLKERLRVYKTEDFLYLCFVFKRDTERGREIQNKCISSL